MRRKALPLLLALVSTCIFVFSGCKPTPTPPKSTAVIENTNLGFVRTTDVVKNPSNDVTIEVISGGSVAANGIDELNYNKTFVANSSASVTNIRQAKVGDVIRITSDYCYIKVEMLGLIPAILYAPTGEFIFQVPAAGTPNWQRPYPAGTFSQNTNVIKATVATDAEIAEERNLALNPYDYAYVNEINVTTQYDQTADGTLPADSVSAENHEVLAYPHAYANRITTGDNRPSFLPRNAIDGDLRTDPKNHINYGAHSWGGGRRPRPTEVSGSDFGFYEDLTYVLYFGREVTVSELSFVMRADYSVYSGNLEHDTNFTEITAEFSDGSIEVLTDFQKGDQKQTRTINPVKTSYVRLKDFKRNITAISENWTALTEFEAYGSDGNINTPAQKTTVVNTFGGKEIKYKTSEYSASAVKEIVDFASADVRKMIQARDPNVTDSWWIDGVLFSAVMDAYTTTGTLDQYLYMQESFDRFQYLIRAREAATASRKHYSKNLSSIVNGYSGLGEASDYADDYLIGETYLLMNDLRPSPNKVFASYANADANMKNAPSWEQNFNANSPGDTFNWWWCDAVYMGLNYFTLMSEATQNPAYIEKAYRSYQHWKSVLACNDNHTVNGEGHGSAAHGGDWALWHRDDNAGNSRTNNTVNPAAANIPTFWARGNAWVFAGIAKQMLYLDQDKYPEIYQAYKNDLIAMAKTLKHYQRADGSWRASVVDPTHNDGKEATGTSGYVYGLAIGVQLGILPADEYMDTVKKGFDQLLTMRSYGDAKVPDGRFVYMQAVGWNAALYPGEEAVSTMTNSFGYGLFIHAAAAVMRMCSDYNAPALSVPADAQYGVIKVPEYSGVMD